MWSGSQPELVMPSWGCLGLEPRESVPSVSPWAHVPALSHVKFSSPDRKGQSPPSGRTRAPSKTKATHAELGYHLSPAARKFGSLCKQPRNREARKLGIREATEPENQGEEAREPSQGEEARKPNSFNTKKENLEAKKTANQEGKPGQEAKSRQQTSTESPEAEKPKAKTQKNISNKKQKHT